MSLTEPDLRFLVETVATERRDYDHLVELVRDKEDFVQQMLDDPKVIQRLLDEKDALVRISPYMLFSVLLREIRREVEQRGYLYEPESRGRKVAVFEGPAVVELLSDVDARDYLAGLLSSFVRTNTGVVYWRERGTWHRRKFNDTDMDDMIALARMVDRDLRPRYCQRIAEIALFLSGIFPDRAVRVAAHTRSTLTTERTLRDYEQEGQRYYGLAAREASEPALRTVLETLADKFTLARSAFNHLSQCYLREQRGRLFRGETSAGAA